MKSTFSILSNLEVNHQGWAMVCLGNQHNMKGVSQISAGPPCHHFTRERSKCQLLISVACATKVWAVTLKSKRTRWTVWVCVPASIHLDLAQILLPLSNDSTCLFSFMTWWMQWEIWNRYLKGFLIQSHCLQFFMTQQNSYGKIGTVLYSPSRKFLHSDSQEPNGHGQSTILGNFNMNQVCMLSLMRLTTHNVDQPVHWCLDTLHRHRLRYTDRPYGGKLSKDINRISSLFY